MQSIFSPATCGRAGCRRAWFHLRIPSLLVAALLPLSPAIAADRPQIATDHLEEILVVASRLPTETYKVGRAVTVLDRAAIDNLGYAYAADVFRFVPGVAVNRTGGYSGQAQVRVRGAEANHSVVLIDGVDVSAAGSGEFDLSSLLSADIERIEVLRGPQSGLYGSNALGGVISITTRPPEQGFLLRTELEGGANETRHGALSVAGGGDTLRGRLTYVRRRSEFDLSVDDSILGSEEDEDDNRSISGQLIYDAADNLSIELFGRHSDRRTEVDGFDFSGGDQQGLAIDDDTVTDTVDLTAGARISLGLADGRSVSKLSVARTETEIVGGTFGSESDRDDLRLDSSWRWHSDGVVEQRSTLFVQAERSLSVTCFHSIPVRYLVRSATYSVMDSNTALDLAMPCSSTAACAGMTTTSSMTVRPMQ